MSEQELKKAAEEVVTATQRVRLLVNGVAGPLSEKQRALAMGVLQDLESAGDRLASVRKEQSLEVTNLDLGISIKESLRRFLFKARARQQSFRWMGQQTQLTALCDRLTLERYLGNALEEATGMAVSGGLIDVATGRSADRFFIDLKAPGWNPMLPPAAPTGSGLAASVIRAPDGPKLVLSVPAAL